MRACAYWILTGIAGLGAACATAGCGAPIASLAEIVPTLLALEAEPPQIIYGHSFASRGNLTLKMDLFLPRGRTAPSPAVVLVHGGYWLFGEPVLMHDWAVDLATQGYVAVTPEYRLLGEGGQYPAPVADVLAAIAEVRARAAEWNVDPDRIALFGDSAGAHLALLAGMVPDASVYEPAMPPGAPAGVRAIVEIYGPTDFTADLSAAQAWQVALVTRFMGSAREQAPDRWREASPANYARADGPPVLIIHADNDRAVPFDQAERLSAALTAARQPHQMIALSGDGHLWGSYWVTASAQQQRGTILGFLSEHLD